jgi:uncharacterized membrane protein
MAPLIIMAAGWLLFRLLGGFGLLDAARSWPGALRFGLALMFVATAAAHFVPRARREMVAMVPPRLPAPGLLVTLTGILELAGAIGLLLPALARTAAYALIALLVAMFPANVHAARMQLPVAGRTAMPLRFRLPLQLFWIGALWWVGYQTH